jgi:ElaB/YqjD/DUF883 family membrane-anchored ribosome-binding protein
MSDSVQKSSSQFDKHGALIEGMDLEAVRAEISSLRKQFEKVSENVIEKAKGVDSTVHINPYPFVLGAFGIGFMAGGILMKRR